MSNCVFAYGHLGKEQREIKHRSHLAPVTEVTLKYLFPKMNCSRVFVTVFEGRKNDDEIAALVHLGVC